MGPGCHFGMGDVTDQAGFLGSGGKWSQVTLQVRHEGHEGHRQWLVVGRTAGLKRRPQKGPLLPCGEGATWMRARQPGVGRAGQRARTASGPWMGNEVGRGATFPDGGGAGLILSSGLQVGHEGFAEPRVQRGQESEGTAAELARQWGGGHAGSSGEATKRPV